MLNLETNTFIDSHLIKGYRLLSQQSVQNFQESRLGVELLTEINAILALNTSAPNENKANATGIAAWLMRKYHENAQSKLEAAKITSLRAMLVKRADELSALLFEIDLIQQRNAILELEHNERLLLNPLKHTQALFTTIEKVSDKVIQKALLAYFKSNEALLLTPTSNEQFIKNVHIFADGLGKFLCLELLSSIPQKEASSQNPLSQSIAWLFQNQKIKQGKELLKDLAFTHGCIQFIGFSTQNEGSLLAGLDIFNYLEYTQSIKEIKGILASLARIFQPLYKEYVMISQMRGDRFSKVLRTVVPSIILATVVVAILTPLALSGVPELALAFVLIPSVFIGLCAASSYAHIREDIHKKLRTWYYQCDEYELPEYKVNDCLRSRFINNMLLAKCVRLFYINLIKNLRNTLENLAKKSSLGNVDIATIDDTTKQLQAVLLEWVDIHDNRSCSNEDVYAIVKARIVSFCNPYYLQMKKICEDQASILKNQMNAIVSGENQPTPSPQKTNWASFWGHEKKIRGTVELYQAISKTEKLLTQAPYTRNL